MPRPHPQLHLERIRCRRVGVPRRSNRFRWLRLAAERGQGRGRQGRRAVRQRRVEPAGGVRARSRSPTTWPGVDGLVLDGPTLAKIFNGAVTTWNAPEIGRSNQAQPAGEQINVIFRSDESGTTDNFQKYLDAASDGAWGKGAGKTFDGGVGEGAKGNEGTSAAIKNTAGLRSPTTSGRSPRTQDLSDRPDRHLGGSGSGAAHRRDRQVSPSTGVKVKGEGNDLVLGHLVVLQAHRAGRVPDRAGDLRDRLLEVPEIRDRQGCSRRS